MSIVLVGLNHRTAPVGLRERLSLAGTALRTALEDLCGRDGSCYSGRSQAPCARAGPATLHEGVILSTCNRLEVYAVAEETRAAWEAIAHFLARRHGLALDLLSTHLYCKDGRAAIEHLMRVTAGLDSMILGDPQILGQVAHAFGEAQAARTIGAILSHLFAQALHAGKRARTETGVSRQTTSVGHAAALLVKAKVEDLSCTPVLVVGAGKMAALAARALHLQGARDITCINRTCARAEAVAGQVQGQALTWACLSDGLAAADVVITATGAPHTVIGVDDMGPVLARRSGRSLLFVDIAVPRDVDTAVGDLPNVHRYDVDDLQAVLDANWAQRQAAVPAVEAVVQEAVEHVTTWLHSRQVVPVIAGLRRKVEALANAEVEQALRRLDEPDQRTQQVIVHLAHRIVNKLLHEPTARLKAQAANGNGHAYAQAIQELFGPDIPEAIAGLGQTSHADGTTAPWPANTSMRLPRLPQECER